jgi:hypothetical protein
MGSTYQRGKVLWSKWHQEGRVIRQSLSTRDEAEAKRMLKERMSQMVTSKRPTTSKAMWNVAAADLLTSYRAYSTRNPVEAGCQDQASHHLLHGDAPGLDRLSGHRRVCRPSSWSGHDGGECERRTGDPAKSASFGPRAW